MKHTSTYFPWVKRGFDSVSKDVFACFVPLGGNKRWNFSESRKWGVCTVGISAGPAGAVCGVGAAVHTSYNTWWHVISATVWIESGLHSQGNAILQKWFHRISICDHLWQESYEMTQTILPKGSALCMYYTHKTSPPLPNGVVLHPPMPNGVVLHPPMTNGVVLHPPMTNGVYLSSQF